MAAGPNDLTTLAGVKLWLGIPSGTTTSDALLQQLITEASAFIQTVINRTIAQAQYSEARDGKSQDVMVFANYPVTAVSAVAVGNQTVLPSPDGVQQGFVFDDTRLVLVGGLCFPRGRMNCKFSYTAGYATVPADLQRACEEMVGTKFKTKDRIGVSSKTLANEVITYTKDDVTASIQTVLNEWMRVVPV